MAALAKVHNNVMCVIDQVRYWYFWTFLLNMIPCTIITFVQAAQLSDYIRYCTCMAWCHSCIENNNIDALQWLTTNTQKVNGGTIEEMSTVSATSHVCRSLQSLLNILNK